MEINNITPQSERAKMLNKLQGYKLAAYDLGLFLNTHPTDKRALAMHKELCQKADEMAQDFEKNFGPLSMCANKNDESWDWIDGPWPWEQQ